MCGIAGFASLSGQPVASGIASLNALSSLIAHRGPDGSGRWLDEVGRVGLVHRRLAIIDLTPAGAQPMKGPNGTVISYNGEIYNFIELRKQLSDGWVFESNSDTEVILAAYSKWGERCVDHLRGMFAFAIWDERNKKLFAARDRFGIKPFYYTTRQGVFYFASEAKALLPFLSDIETDADALSEYLTFQYTIGRKTLFKGISTLLPGHMLRLDGGEVVISRYWDVQYDVDFDHSPSYFERRFAELLSDSMHVHLRSDVPVGGYVSGGLDSSLVALMAARLDHRSRDAFHGRFLEYPGYDESGYAKTVADLADMSLHMVDITASDFRNHIGDVIYHLDFPVAGPGSFPQYMVSALAAKKVKVVLGGQGGDELLGGYARYLVAYFEQCIKAAIDGTYKSGHYVVTIESIVPNLGLLREYKPLIKEFWRDGLFADLDQRYFRLVDRSTDMVGEVDWHALNKQDVFESFRAIFNNQDNVRKEAYFDKMTHFDFKCLLPALLHVEDRMSMAHGLESRVPLLDHPLVEFLASVPADVKFMGGQMKQLMKTAYSDVLPKELLERRDKMGFPVPLKEWFDGELKDFVLGVFGEQRARHRPYFNSDVVLSSFGVQSRFSRKTWGLLSLELWHQRFHDRAAEFRAMVKA
ncbi:asparagine synthase (glutamine-hydrolyzing) [Bradyrhizobium sp. INPA01-394B]|uniref:asparagine synthase (glutamine-hydrolyzing) n=1 Tax=Bradyrhizobium campsiandrae TaxID=1729892 RepID=A0ABR7UAD0_9BRAD|nr:asparagine synthase (glutamine-hydrolyzing) [Bradyrhizobium campsiandrae]MBC9877529.1 asparagine synthase (glutamine-hydrolyzing) [Bradyrhizobium campsiandrae]MBC9980476.1 asparagine synthase (glutamine-hydrolyzing) [Bradyrhizobium campsiandrae]